MGHADQSVTWGMQIGQLKLANCTDGYAVSSFSNSFNLSYRIYVYSYRYIYSGGFRGAKGAIAPPPPLLATSRNITLILALSVIFTLNNPAIPSEGLHPPHPLVQLYMYFISPFSRPSEAVRLVRPWPHQFFSPILIFPH